jgi:hypothetical protein
MGNQRVLSSTERYAKHTENNTTVEYAPLSLLQVSLIHVKKWLQKTYNLHHPLVHSPDRHESNSVHTHDNFLHVRHLENLNYLSYCDDPIKKH